MSATETEFNPEDFEGLNPASTTIHNAELRKLRKQAQKASELEARLAEMERRETFARAGIPLDDPAARYFVKGYDGPLEPEAIRQAATEARILTANTPSDDEIRAHQNAAQAAAGGTPTGIGLDVQAQLAEMAKKTFAATDDVGMQNHIQGIARFAKENGIGIPVT